LALEGHGILYTPVQSTYIAVGEKGRRARLNSRGPSPAYTIPASTVKLIPQQIEGKESQAKFQGRPAFTIPASTVKLIPKQIEGKES
jgi:hypothetical protein